nr:hypothetical protein [Deltaproteobacteria bacterium]
MAKTESTAVNDLIKIATTQTPLRHDPSDDLMFAAPSKKDRSSKHALVPSGTEVAPLPRNRAPLSTQQHAIAMPAHRLSSAAISPPPMPALKMSSPAIVPPPMPTLKMSSPAIVPPPIPAPPSLLADVPERLSDPSLEPIATRATRPSLPPPTRASAPPPVRIAIPSEYPIVTPMVAPAPAIEDIAPLWGDDSLDVDVQPFHGDSTAQLAKPRTTLQWMIKLAPVAGAMILLGVIIGGFLVFGGKGDKQDTAAAASGAVEVKVLDEQAAPVAVAAPAPGSPTEAAPTPPAPVTPPNLAAVATESAPATATTDSAGATNVPSTATKLASTAVAPTTAAPTAAAPTIAAPSTVTTATAATTASPSTAVPAQPSIATRAPTSAAIAARPVFVDVRIDSKPTGATVMLVDRGKQTFLGTTPISTAVDPSRAYEIVFSHPRRPTQTQHLDPKTTTRLAVVLSRSSNRPTMDLAKPPTAAAVAKPAIAKPAKVA